MLLTNAVNTEGRPLEIYVKDGKIAAVGQDLSALAAENETVVDAGGLTVLPAFVDLHCHWRTPGFEYKEDIETGSRAAAAGGYTFVNLMPNTKPVCSSAAQAFMVEQKAAEVGLCDANQTVSITENFDGVSIDHLKTLPASVKFITEDGHGVQDNATMARAFAICTQRDITVMSHAEDMEISPWDYRLAEDIETVRNCWLSEYYQTRLHMCHVSTRGALDAIRTAKLRGAPVTCEVTPHHLWFTNDSCDYRVNPPIRTADDVEALVEGIRTGIVDAIATDHAPHSEEDKLKGMAGMVGSETAFGVCYTKLCKQEGLPLELLVHLMSTRPAEILGLAKGQLEPGYDADFVLVDLDTPYTVEKEKLHSKSHNTPFDGAQLYGKVFATIKAGKITFGDEVDYCVPTGNFGDILAGYYAKQMGLPVGKLVCASNENNVLTDFLTTGTYTAKREFFKTTSPSMDILVSSNLERLLYHVTGSDAEVAGFMQQLAATGSYTVRPETLATIQETFSCGWSSEAEVAEEIRSRYEKDGYLCDTHTAVAFHVAAQKKRQGVPMVVLSTASPFKFPRSVLSALGKAAPENDFEAMQQLEAATGHAAPASLAALRSKPERFDTVIAPAQIAEVALGYQA